MYEKIEVACYYCKGTGIGEYVSEYGPFGFNVTHECHECEGSGKEYKLIDPFENEDEEEDLVF